MTAWIISTIDGHTGISVEFFTYLAQWLSEDETRMLIASLSPKRLVSLVLYCESQKAIDNATRPL